MIRKIDTNSDEFLNELISTGAVLSGNVLAAGFNIIERTYSTQTRYVYWQARGWCLTG